MQEEHQKLRNLYQQLYKAIDTTEFTPVDNDIKMSSIDYERILIIKNEILSTLFIINNANP